MGSYVVGVDTGGTFTDIVALRDDGVLFSAKAATTPEDRSRGVMESVESVARRAGVPTEELLGSTDTFMHGSTVATNALITRAGARVGLVTTSGFEDTIYIMRAIGRVDGLPDAEVRHVTKVQKPVHVVMPEDIVGIHERIDVHGKVVVPVNKEEVRNAIDELLGSREVDAIAVSLINAWANPEHEEFVLHQFKDAVALSGREIFLCAGHDLSKVAGEYARTNAAVLNAFVGPVVSSYLTGLAEKLRASDFAGRFLVMQGNGGAADFKEAPPIANLQSGPAGGMLAARRLADSLGHGNVITADMGGTSFDVGLLRDGEWAYAEEPIFERFRITQPMIDVKSIGAGGGTIARVQTDTGRLVVGPQSAGAHPGPACYDQGGTEATVTDVDVVLGMIDPDCFLGGARPLSRERATDALTRIAEPLGTDAVTAAGSVFEIVNNKMADLLRNEIVRSGGLPEAHVLYAFGGAGPLHGPFCADALGMGAVVVPGTSAVFSAMGAGEADIVWSHLSTLDLAFPEQVAEINAAIAEAEEQLRSRLLGAGPDELESTIDFNVFGSLRYRRQTSDVEIQLSEKRLTEQTASSLVQDFEELYEQRFGPGAVYHGASIELSRLRVDAVRPLGYPARRLEPDVGVDATRAIKGRREVNLPRREAVVVDVYDWVQLQHGNRIEGPSLVESELTTIAIPHGWVTSMDGYRNLLMTRAEL